VGVNYLKEVKVCVTWDVMPYTVTYWREWLWPWQYGCRFLYLWADDVEKTYRFCQKHKSSLLQNVDHW